MHVLYSKKINYSQTFSAATADSEHLCRDQNFAGLCSCLVFSPQKLPVSRIQTLSCSCSEKCVLV